MMQSDTTSAPGGATAGARTCLVPTSAVNAIADALDRQGGAITRAQAAKQLSSLLSAEIERALDYSRTVAGDSSHISFRLSRSNVDTITWLATEVWLVAEDLATKVDNIANEFTEIANAAYDAEKAK